MAITRPFFRTCRPFKDGEYESEHSAYIRHPLYAKSPEHYTRAFLLIQKDMQTLFDYVEPADQNLHCYSFRIHELLLRTCVEIEANFKAILAENGYAKDENLNMSDYKKVNASHRLSFYQSRFPIWTGQHQMRLPFEAWAQEEPLRWYQTYNRVKHDRHVQFKDATFENLTNAFCALHILVSSQFYTNEFTASDWTVGVESPDKNMQSGIGDYLWIKFPDWPLDERYEFNWGAIEGDNPPFLAFDYSRK